MKLDARRIPAFLRDPGPARIVLLHGEDEGLIRQRADALTQAVIGGRDDPFRVAWLAREDHARLAEEASAIAMLGGRRVVRVRDAADALAGPLEQARPAPGDSLVVLRRPARCRRARSCGRWWRACHGRRHRLLSGGGQGAAGPGQWSGLAEAGITLDPDAQAMC